MTVISLSSYYLIEVIYDEILYLTNFFSFWVHWLENPEKHKLKLIYDYVFLWKQLYLYLKCEDSVTVKD